MLLHNDDYKKETKTIFYMSKSILSYMILLAILVNFITENRISVFNKIGSIFLTAFSAYNFSPIIIDCESKQNNYFYRIIKVFLLKARAKY